MEKIGGISTCRRALEPLTGCSGMSSTIEVRKSAGTVCLQGKCWKKVPLTVKENAAAARSEAADSDKMHPALAILNFSWASNKAISHTRKRELLKVAI